MKLKENIYQDKVQSYQIGKIDARMQGLALDQSLTIQLTNKDFAYSAKTGTRRDNGQPYRIPTIVGKVIGEKPENVVYNDFDNARFQFGDAIDKYLAPIEKDLAGKTIDIKLVEKEFNIPKRDSDGNVEKDQDGNMEFQKKTVLTFEVGLLNDDGSITLLSKGGSGSSTPSSSTPPPPIPKEVDEVNKEAGFDLTETEKAVFKAVRTDSVYAAWKDFGKKSLNDFRAMYDMVSDRESLPKYDEDRVERLYKRYISQ